MAGRTDFEALVYQMSADIRRLETANNKALGIVNSTADRAQKRYDRLGAEMGRSITPALKRLAPLLAATFSTQKIIQYADAYTALQNRLKATGLQGEALKAVEDRLFEAANRNGVAVSATAELYQRAAMARNNLGASEEQLLALVSGTSAALRLQGTSAEQASGALLQLGQILGGEKVQAQEYNSLIDQLPVLLQAAADGSSRFGGEISNLTKQVKDGKVTTQEFFNALLSGLVDVEARSAAATATVGQSLQHLNNELGRYVGQTDSGLSATQRMAGGINALADNLDRIAPVVTVLIGLVGARYAGALALSAGATVAATVESARYQLALIGLAAQQANVTRASVLATAATRGLSAAIAANPLGAALLVVTALGVGLYLLASRLDAGARAARELDAVTGATTNALDEYERAAREAATATGANASKAIQNANAMRLEATEALRAAKALRERTAAMSAELAGRAAARLSAMQGGLARGGRSAALGVDAGLYEGAKAQADAAARFAKNAATAAAAAERRLAAIDRQMATGGYRPSSTPPDAAARSAGAAQRSPKPDGFQPFDESDLLTADVANGWSLEDWLRTHVREIETNPDLRGGPPQLARGLGGELLPPEEIDAATQRLSDGMQSAFESLRSKEDVMAWLADKFKARLADNLFDMLAKMLTQLGQGANGGGGGWIATAATAFAGMFAGGGTIPAGQWGVVNDGGPEAIRARPGGGVDVLNNGALRALQASRPGAVGATRVSYHTEHKTFDLRGAVLTNEIWAEIRAVDQRSAQRTQAVAGALGEATTPWAQNARAAETDSFRS